MIKMSEKVMKPLRSVRGQLTLLMVALLGCCCVILTWLVYRSTAQLLEVAAANSLRQGGLSIVLDVAGIERSILSDALVILVFVIIAGSCAAYLLAGHYTKPIKQLSSHMRELAPDSLSRPIEVESGGEEIQELVKSFNQMTGQLSEAFAMQSRFSVSAAHELRTPLAVLRTRLDVFKKKEREQKEYDELVQTMETYVDRLSSLISNLLELTETGELPEVEDVSLDSVIKTVVKDLEPVAHEHEVKIHTDIESLTVRGNGSLLYRALYNLVENAIRYNEKEGSITIDLKNQDTAGMVKIADTGVGIAPEARELIFEPFYRVNKSRSREFGGAGIGLSLVKAILKRHGAFIAVDANEPQGSVFTITFPKDGSADGEKFVDAEETSAEAAEETSTEVSEDPSVDVAEAFVDVEDPSTEAEEKTPAEAAETDEQSVVQN
ncbi:HAMP domain-containing sensor histidine kinase [Lancefieldella rimae]|uniref:sensor histidine kinase n=1 Tax=Lancefieldella rimae TaxID=1383 RepID=UPI002889E84C|nr:HAMP domain-containing sensor histidine kinase [Lancefieldella rimae]